MKIPFNRPYQAQHALDYLSKSWENGHTSGAGPFSRRCEAWLEERVGVERALLTTSCTHALEMCALLLNLEPGDEVIMPSYTFVSTANAFVIHGAVPRFVDIRQDTQNLDEQQVEAAITERTRAIGVVHYAGVACEMERICELAERHNLMLIEDNAHGLLGAYQGRPLGTFGQLATLSFHETKNFSCGEGGALLINDSQLAGRAEILREKGTNRSAFFRGEVDKYSWVDKGSSYVMADLLAAALFAQFEEAETIQSARQAAWDYYHERLKPLEDAGVLQLPAVPDGCEQAYHLFYFLLRDGSQLQDILTFLREAGVHAVFHYLPLHSSEFGRQYALGPDDCPQTTATSERLVRLPFFVEITRTEQDRAINAIYRFFDLSPAHELHRSADPARPVALPS